MSLLWLYCISWEAHGQPLISLNGFWQFDRDDLRNVLFDLSFPDPDEVLDKLQASGELIDLLKANVKKSSQKLIPWLNDIYKVSIESIPKRKHAMMV